MNKVLKVSIIVLGIALLIGGTIYYKLFFIGNSNYEKIVINKITTSDKDITINGLFTDSGVAYKNYTYTLVGKELYIKVNNVLVSNKYNSGSFNISIPLGINNVDNIHLTNDKSTKVIYKK